MSIIKLTYNPNFVDISHDFLNSDLSTSLPSIMLPITYTLHGYKCQNIIVHEASWIRVKNY